MPPTHETTEEIIEKRETSPFETACLVLAALFLLAAIAIQLAGIAELRRNLSQRELAMTGKQRALQDLREINTKVEKILADTAISADMRAQALSILGQATPPAEGPQGSGSSAIPPPPEEDTLEPPPPGEGGAAEEEAAPPIEEPTIPGFEE